VTTDHPTATPSSGVRVVARTILGGILLVAGVGHLTSQREEFRAQVPAWVPLSEDLVVVASGVVEIALGLALLALLLPALSRHRVAVGLVVAAFFVAVFPGNVAQWSEGRDAFGLDTDGERLARLFFQPVLVLLALWSTGASAVVVDRLRDRRGRPAGSPPQR
jgi:uncharacterized membrane protein